MYKQGAMTKHHLLKMLKSLCNKVSNECPSSLSRTPTIEQNPTVWKNCTKKSSKGNSPSGSRDVQILHNIWYPLGWNCGIALKGLYALLIHAAPRYGPHWDQTIWQTLLFPGSCVVGFIKTMCLAALLHAFEQTTLVLPMLFWCQRQKVSNTSVYGGF